jgi:AhpD family alkylhydroperoxidase
MLGLSAYVKASRLEASLRELVKIRVSQINGCAYCLAMHIAQGRHVGLGEDRMHLLPAWRETSIYTERERAALIWAEAVATLPSGVVPQDAYDEVRRVFTPGEVADLTYAVVEIDGWNRLMIASRTPPEHLTGSGGKTNESR